MAGSSISLIAGLLALGGAGGGVVYVMRRKALAALKAHAPTATPPAASVMAVAPQGIKQLQPLFGSALQDLIAKRRTAFYQLNEQEQQLVIAAEYIRDSLAALVNQLEQPWTHYEGTDELKARCLAYINVGVRLLPDWPKLLDARAAVWLVDYTDPNHGQRRVFHYLSTSQNGKPIPGAPKTVLVPPYQIILHGLSKTMTKPPAWWAKQIHDSIREWYTNQTSKPWDPTLPTADMPAEWILDAGRALADAFGSNDDVAKAAQAAAKSALEGAERVFGSNVTLAQLQAERERVLALIVEIVALCDFWLRFRFW